MALIIPVGFGQAVYRMSLAGDVEEMVTTCGHDLSAVPGGDYADAATVLFTYFSGNWAAQLGTGYTFLGVTLYVGQDGGPPAVFESTNSSGVAATGGQPLPQNTAVLVRKRTDAAGRRGRGRCYLPGAVKAQVGQTGDIQSSYLSGLSAQAEQWWEDCQNGAGGFEPYPMVILHRSEGAGAEPPPTPITALTVEPYVATQRRRLRP